MTSLIILLALAIIFGPTARESIWRIYITRVERADDRWERRHLEGQLRLIGDERGAYDPDMRGRDRRVRERTRG